MFFLKKVYALIREKGMAADLRELGRKLSADGITLLELTGLPPGEETDSVIRRLQESKNGGGPLAPEKPGAGRMDSPLPWGEPGLLWLTDMPEWADLLIRREEPLLVCLTEGNRGQDFPMAGYAAEGLKDLETSYLERIYRRFAGIPWDIVTTARCRVRETVMEDCPALEELYAHPGIRRYLEGLYPPGEGRGYLEQYIQKVYVFFEYGIWTVVDRQSQAVIGRAGFRPGAEGVPELGYMIGVPWQGQGRAYEVCEALLKYAGEELAFEKVRAVVEKENEASIALCRKLGFRKTGTRVEEEKEYFCFERIEKNKKRD